MTFTLGKAGKMRLPRHLTRDQAVDLLMTSIEKLQADANRRLVTDMIAGGHTDAEIEGALQIAYEWQAEERPNLRRSIGAEVDWLRAGGFDAEPHVQVH